MNRKNRPEKGQALIIVAAAIIGLVAIAGLAVDGGIALSDRRHAQNAADAASLAGALAKINAQKSISDGGLGFDEVEARAPMRIAALDWAASNGYTNNLIDSVVEVYTCDEVDASCEVPYAGDSDYVQVIITSYFNTYFAKVIGVEQMENRVQAVALADDDDTGPLYDGRSIISLNPSCPPNGSMVISGDSLITINGGGLYANADETCALKCTSTSVDVEIENGGISSPASSFTLSEHCQGVLSDDGLSYEDTEAYPYPPELPVFDFPAECDSDFGHSVTGGEWDDPVHGTVTASFLSPGYYETFPPKKDDEGNNLANEIVLASGTYCVDTVLKLNSDVLHLWGDGITIWIRAGNGFTINGGVVQLFGSSSTYPGYLIIVEPDYEGAVTACSLEGNATNEYIGAIYAPHCNVDITGTADTPPTGIDSQIIGYNVTINGTSNLTINYTEDNNPVIEDPPKLGLTK